MAGGDYLSCRGCGCKTIYDAEVNYEYANCGHIIALCKDCAKANTITMTNNETSEVVVVAPPGFLADCQED